jgi:Leucine-rich repeat (LRR) protein
MWLTRPCLLLFETAAHLDFSDNLLTQGVPDEIYEYPNLKFLILSGNVALGSTIPSCLVNTPKLCDLELGNCGLMDSLPPWLGQLTDLVILDLSTNFLTSTIPVAIGELTDLEHLEL